MMSPMFKPVDAASAAAYALVERLIFPLASFFLEALGEVAFRVASFFLEALEGLAFRVASFFLEALEGLAFRVASFFLEARCCWPDLVTAFEFGMRWRLQVLIKIFFKKGPPI